MSKSGRFPATLAEKSSWTPKSYVPSNETIYEERMSLIKKWYAAWSGSQRWALLEFVLMQLSDKQLTLLHTLLHPSMPTPAMDFTRCLPRVLSLRIFSLLDPQTLCRAARVCWYWKYLAEANKIWQEKCLRLGWFLPAPPPHHDCTLWKRHYIECVCQLHWNPPQPPSNDEDDDNAANTNDFTITDNSQRRTRLVPRHYASSNLKKPWRDPDPHPSDTHYKYLMDPATMTICPYLKLASMTKVRESMGVGSHIMLLKPPSPTASTVHLTHTTQSTLLPLPTSLLHPALLEKMRLSSPSSAHVHLSTLNRHQTENEISETFYELQNVSPFPKLPPYFVHKSNFNAGSSDSGDDKGGTFSGQGIAAGIPLAAHVKRLTSAVPEEEELLCTAWTLPGDYDTQGIIP